MREDSRAIWERIKLVPFDVTFKDPANKKDPIGPGDKPMDKTLKDALQQERAGVCAWIVRGAMLYFKDYNLHQPARITKAVETYRAESDELQAWVDERLTKAADLKCAAKDLYADFRHYKLEREEYLLPYNVWGRRMTKKIGKPQYTNVGAVYHGIALKPYTKA